MVSRSRIFHGKHHTMRALVLAGGQNPWWFDQHGGSFSFKPCILPFSSKKTHPLSPLSESSILWDDNSPSMISVFFKNPNHLFYSISTNWPTTFFRASTSPRLREIVPNPKIRYTELPRSDVSSDERWQKKVWREGMEIPKYSFAWTNTEKWELIRNYPIRCFFSNAIRQFRILCVHSCSTTRAIFKHLGQMEHQNL